MATLPKVIYKFNVLFLNEATQSPKDKWGLFSFIGEG